MYTLTPKQIEAELGRQASRGGGISIVLVENVPESLVTQMRPFD